MKYIKGILCLVILLLTGCSMGNTPTSKVEDLFVKYQTLDETVVSGINKVVDEKDLTKDQKTRYRKVLEKQYRSLTYEIKDEKIDGDNATVTVEIKVMDYKKAIENISINDYSFEEYNNKKLDALENYKELITYTLEIGLTKDGDNNWKINALSNTDIKKIQGMF